MTRSPLGRIDTCDEDFKNDALVANTDDSEGAMRMYRINMASDNDAKRFKNNNKVKRKAEYLTFVNGVETDRFSFEG